MEAADHQGIRMNGGEGENSYAKNSTIQGSIQEMLVPVLEEAVVELCRAGVPGRVAIADLGCSSGPNALVLVSSATGALRRRCALTADGGGGGGGELCVYLNDLPGNDYNTVFKSLPVHFPPEPEQDSDAQPPPPLVFVFGAPGSFHGRLFPAGTLHLVCSSNSLHWLSKVPEELQSGKLVNKNNICVGRTSPPEAVSAYARQFRSDFSLFLRSRAKELVPGGWLLVAFKAVNEDAPWSDVMADALHDMASRGVISAEKLETFHLPIYEPHQEELREAIEAEGSFDIIRLELRKITYDNNAAVVARALRAGQEAVLAQHFGRAAGMMEEFVRTTEGFVERLQLCGRFSSKVAFHVVALRNRC